MGATACIVIPGFVDWMNEKAGRDWRVLAWFIHGQLPYSEMVFFVQNAAVSLTWRGDPLDPIQDGDVRRFDGSSPSIVWRSEPRRRISNFNKPKGLMMKNGEPTDGHRRYGHYEDFLHHLHDNGARPSLSDCLQQLREAKREEDARFEGLVEAWKAVSEPISFDKWRSREVCRIRKAWSAAKGALRLPARRTGTGRGRFSCP